MKLPLFMGISWANRHQHPSRWGFGWSSRVSSCVEHHAPSTKSCGSVTSHPEVSNWRRFVVLSLDNYTHYTIAISRYYEYHWLYYTIHIYTHYTIHIILYTLYYCHCTIAIIIDNWYTLLWLITIFEPFWRFHVGAVMLTIGHHSSP